MHAFEILTPTDDLKIKATGSTRAALIEAALAGLFALAVPKLADPEALPSVERTFKKEAPDFSALMAGVLDEAAALSAANGETYDAMKFTLITADKAEGVFIGRPVKGFETVIASVERKGLSPDRNAEGAWEAVMSFRA